MKNCHCLIFLCVFLLSFICEGTDYGVDVTTPIHHRLTKNSIFKSRYDETMSGCYKKYSKRECDACEISRMEMNLEQTRTQHNYTEMGFKKTRVPAAVWKTIIEFYNSNKAKEKPELWPRGNTYVNSWDSPTGMVSFEDTSLRGGQMVKQAIWDGVKPVIEEWTGKKVTPTSLYGIRIYKDKAILATHVDRMPLVSSCIINVDQELNEPWPVEVYSHAGKAYNVTMQPGDMVLYESHTVLHGRPFPLNGTRFANIFVHFMPLDHDEENAKDPLLSGTGPGTGTINKWSTRVDDHKTVGGHEQGNHNEDTLNKHRDNYDAASATDQGQTALHLAAIKGDLEEAKWLLKDNSDSDLLHARDINDWQALHEAVRAGQLDMVKYLVQMGADVGAKTSKGGSPLWWAKQFDNTEGIIKYLEDLHAPDEGEQDH